MLEQVTRDHGSVLPVTTVIPYFFRKSFDFFCQSQIDFTQIYLISVTL